jgi:hypothetical protein
MVIKEAWRIMIAPWGHSCPASLLCSKDCVCKGHFNNCRNIAISPTTVAITRSQLLVKSPVNNSYDDRAWKP